MIFPKYCFGTHSFTSKKKSDIFQYEKILHKCLDKGIFFFDTADEYGGGQSENILGNFFKKENLSQKIIISSKIGNLNNFRDEDLQKYIDNILKRLKVDKLDVLYFHSGTNKQFFNDNFWNIMNKNKEKGKILKLGLSLKTKNLRLQNFEQVKQMKKYNIEVLCTTHNLLFDYNKFLKKNTPSNIIQISRMPFANGFVFLRKSLLFYFKLLKNKKNNFLNNDNYSLLNDIQKKYDYNDEKIMKHCLKYNLKDFKSVIFSSSNIRQIERINFS